MILILGAIYDSCGLIFVKPQKSKPYFVYPAEKIVIQTEEKKVDFLFEWSDSRHIFIVESISHLILFLKKEEVYHVLDFTNLRLNIDKLDYVSNGCSYTKMLSDNEENLFVGYTKTEP